MSDTQFFSSEGLELAYTVTGNGPPLLLLHGWPFHKASFRKLVPLLAPHFTCYSLDSAGMGQSEWTSETELGFHGHVRRAIDFVDHLGLSSYDVVGHDTGGTIARLMALADAERIQSVTVIDTEIPHRFPPTVTLLQKLHSNIFTRPILKLALASESFARSPRGYGGFFSDKSLFTDEFMDLFVHFWQHDRHTYGGLMAYLCAIDPAIVDTLDDVHARTQVPMLFIWGKGDPIFPLKHAQAMVDRIPGEAELVAISSARFLPHEEKPEAVADHLIAFLTGSQKAA